jgi:hypothetical protein
VLLISPTLSELSLHGRPEDVRSSNSYDPQHSL